MSAQDQGKLIFCLLFLAVWAPFLGSFLYFHWRVAPAALRRWASEQGFSKLETSSAGPRGVLTAGRGGPITLYRIQVRDATGQPRSGLVILGSSTWPCTSVARCPIEVRWDHAKPASDPWLELP